jgi:glutathione synthase/RimK-type ligase-like ATP-grasp enzyme
MDYDEILEKVGTTSIIKPTNASSSRSTFKITSREDFENIKHKLSRSFEYLIEEYI